MWIQQGRETFIISQKIEPTTFSRSAMEGRKFTFKKKTTSSVKPPDVSHLLPLLETNKIPPTTTKITTPTTTAAPLKKSPLHIPFKQSEIQSPDLDEVKSNR